VRARAAAASLFLLACIGVFGASRASAQPGCNLVTMSPQQSVPSGGGTGRITVAGPAGCGWTAVSSDTTWLTITSGASGNGTGVIVYQATANAGSARTATITGANSSIAIVQPGDTNPEPNVSILMTDLPGNRVMHMSNLSGANWEAGPLPRYGSLRSPWHVTQDAAGRIYIADRDNDRVVRMDDITGKGWTTFTGIPGKPIIQPRSVNIGPDGKIYIADSSSRGLIRIDDMAGTNYVNFSGNGSGDAQTLCGIKVIAFDSSGRIYMSDTDHYRIVRINDMSGAGFVDFGLNQVPCGPAVELTGRSGVGQFNRPEGIAIDSSNRIYVTDNENHRIVRINDITHPAAEPGNWTTFGTLGKGVNQVNEPHDIKISPAGRIYIMDTGNGRVIRLDKFEESADNGWTTLGSQPNQGTSGSIAPGLFENIAPKGLWIGPALDSSMTCSYGVSPGNAVLAGAGGSGNLAVTTAAGCEWVAVSDQAWLSVSAGATGNGTVTYSAAANPGATARIAVLALGGRTIAVTQEGVPAATMSLDKTSLVFTAVTTAGGNFSIRTPSQTVRVLQTGAGTVSWQPTASPAHAWLVVTPPIATGSGTVTISVQPAGGLPASGIVTGTVTIPFIGATNASATVSVTLNLVPASTKPFGSFDTPASGTFPLQGSIAVTGWALDDVGIDRVEIWRDLQPGETTPPFASTPSDPRNGKVFISNGTFVDNARPDVEGLYPSTPFNARAGWGYLLLTWGLWSQGNGTYTLFAYAFDTESNLTTLGQKTIVVSNNAANRPFGSIDTPAIGGTASGTVVNFGWGLTPKVNGVATCTIPASGIQVSIDSGPLQPVAYGDARSDIAGAFTGFSNTAAGGGHFVFDSTALANGTHTIGWLITDDCNRADGVGSRFFNVSNGSLAPAVASVAAPVMNARTADGREAVTIARGYGELPVVVEPGGDGALRVTVAQGERIEIRVPREYRSAHQLAAGEPRALPSGATWDPASGTFYWQPAPAFLGRYEIVFTSDSGALLSVHVAVTAAGDTPRK
jgi:sugar lactone lactonase YvrE